MNPLVKTLTGAAVLLVVLAGCASKTTANGAPPAAAGDANSASSPSATPSVPGTTSAPGDSTPPTMTVPLKVSPTSPAIPPGVQVPTTAPSPSQSSGGPGTKPTSGTDQVKYTSPEGVSLAPDGRTLVTPVEWGGCSEQPQLIVMAQDSTKVVVEVKTITHFRLGAMCPNIARVGEASVKLDAPLGSRQVVDGITHVVLATR
jgi:hypothetical protein